MARLILAERRANADPADPQHVKVSHFFVFESSNHFHYFNEIDSCFFLFLFLVLNDQIILIILN